MSTIHDAGLWPPSFDAAVFDFDGTLCETAAIWRRVDEEFLERRGIAYAPDLSERLSALGFRDGAEYVIARFGLNERPEDICDEWNAAGSTLYRDEAHLRAGAERYITALRKQGVPVALATTNDAGVLRSMRHVDVYRLFDVVVCGAEVARGKDHPDIYLEAARRLGADPRRCIAFEDIAAGIDSAHKAGMITCAVRADDPTQDFDELRQHADLWLTTWE